MIFLQRVLINSVIFIAVAGFFPNLFYVSSFWMALLAAVILGVLNMVVKPVLVLLSLPVTMLTLGLFYLVINGVMLELTSSLIGRDFQFNGFGAAFLVALILSIVNMIITGNRTVTRY